jgi:hypothetical protein
LLLVIIHRHNGCSSRRSRVFRPARESNPADR